MTKNDLLKKQEEILACYDTSALFTLRMIGLSARMIWHMAMEKLVKPRSIRAEDIPCNWYTVEPSWMEAVLCRDVPGAKVLSVELGTGHTGSASRQQFLLTYNDIGQKAGLPQKVFAKGTPYLINRISLSSSEAMRWEKHFFEEVRPELNIETPAGYHSNYDFRTGRSIHLMEDLVETKGAEFCNPTMVISRKNAEDVMVLLATLHGTYYNSPRLKKEFSHITEWRYKQRLWSTLMGLKKYHYRGFDKAKPVIPKELYARRDETWPAIVKASELTLEGSLTLLHCDPHLGNWYRTSEGRMGILDWQNLSRGHWSRDVTYAVSSICSIDNRRAWEKDLLRIYLDRMEQVSGRRIPFDEAWLRYRQQIFSALFMWTPTYAPPAFASKNMQPEETAVELLERFAHAIVDLDAFESLNGS